MKVLGQLEKAQLENVTSDAAADPKGTVKYRTDLSAAKISNGTVYKELIDEDTHKRPLTTLGDLDYGGVAGVRTRLPVGTAGQVLTVSGGVPAWVAPSAQPPPFTIFKQISSFGTWTKPAGCRYIEVILIGAGGGGGGSGTGAGAGASGGICSFGPLVATGGAGGGTTLPQNGGTGGTYGGGGGFVDTGSFDGNSGGGAGATNSPGGYGGGASRGGQNNRSGAGTIIGSAPVFGCGGQGGSSGGTPNAGGGGGAGGEVHFMHAAPAASYSWSLVTGGLGGAAGAGGNPGQTGGTGFLLVYEYY